MNMIRPKLYIFVKAPQISKVKTRLAVDIGNVQALRIYRSMSAKIIRNIRDKRWDSVLYITPAKYVCNDFGGVWPANMPRMAQVEGDLSERMAKLFSKKGKVLCVGTDIPDIKKQYIADGFRALNKNNAVIGPANDGGFWALGLNSPAPKNLFDGIRWSDKNTMSDLLNRLEIHALAEKIHYLPILCDIDNVSDYKSSRELHKF